MQGGASDPIVRVGPFRRDLRDRSQHFLTVRATVGTIPHRRSLPGASRLPSIWPMPASSNPRPPGHQPRVARAGRWRVLSATLMLASGLQPALAAGAPVTPFYEDALARYHRQDLTGAIVQLKNAIRIDPKQLAVQMLLGKVLLANGEVGAAEVAFDAALALGVARAEVVVPLAQAVSAQGRLQEVVSGQRFSATGLPPQVRASLRLVQAAALADLNQTRDALAAIDEARAVNPQAAESWLAEVPVRLRGRQYAEASTAVERALTLAPDSPEVHYLRGSIAHAQGDAATALAAYDRCIELRSDHVEARAARAGLKLDQGRLDEALADVAVLKRVAPSDPRAPYLSALVAERRGDATASRAGLAGVTALLDAVPQDFMRYRPQLLMLGGLAHYGLGENQKARPYLQAVLRQQPVNPAAKLLAQIELTERNFDPAIEILEPYVKAVPGDSQAVVLLATAQIGKGRHARASTLLQEALARHDSPRLRTFLGLALIGGGQSTAALAELEKAWRKDPGQIIAGSALADLYLRSHQPQRALPIAQALVQRQPKLASLQSLLGMTQAQLGHPDLARAAYDRALALEPGFTPAQLNLAKLEIQTGALDRAEQRLGRLLTADPKNVDALIERAALADRRGRADAAEQYYAKAVDHSPPADTRAALLLIERQLAGQRLPAAAQTLSALEAKAPDSLAVLMVASRLRLAEGNLPAAQQALVQAARTAEYDPTTLVQIAAQQLAAQDPSGAAYSLSKATQAQPGFLPAAALMVDVNLRLGDLAAAQRGADAIAAANPKLAIGPALAGDVAMARDQTAAALGAYRKAHQIEPGTASVTRLYRALDRQDPGAALQLAESWLRSNPRDQSVRRLMADGYARAGRYPAARSAYQALLAQTPDDAAALNNLANVLLQLKDPSALAVAEQALQRQPTAPSILGTTGWAAFQAGQSDRALALLRDARLRDPGNPTTRYFLAAVLANKGRQGEAREKLQDALKGGAAFDHAVEAKALLATLN